MTYTLADLMNPVIMAKIKASIPAEIISSDGLWTRDVCGNWEPTEEQYVRLGEEIERRPIYSGRRR